MDSRKEGVMARVWTIEREDAIGIFLNAALVRKRIGSRKNVYICIFSNLTEAKEYLWSRYKEIVPSILQELKVNRLFYLY